MRPTTRIVGSYLSPYVRKVLVVLHLKGVPYEIDPIVPFYGNDEFSRLSPIRRIPVLLDDRVTLCDSTVICEYLEERYPDPPLRPADLVSRARARWLEEFADSRMGEVLIWALFNEMAIKPAVWGEASNPSRVEKTLAEDVPQVLDYLETQAPQDGFLFGALSIADVAIACFFRNASFVRFRIDATRWPKTAALVDRVLALEAFEILKPIEDRLRRIKPPVPRAVLEEFGVPLTADSYGTETPRRGMMRID
jgi:glutathione S-transferase